MRASQSSFNFNKKDGLAELLVTTQLDLFDHSVREHSEVARLLCTHHAPKARCMMRQTYSQEWHEYNQAQTNEKTRFLELLYGLCKTIEEPIQTFGRPRLRYSEMVFALCFKIYSTVSSRRFISELTDARNKGYLSKVPHFNSISNYLELENLTPLLKELIVASTLPLKFIESNFAVDSSGFSTGRTQRWVDAKWGIARAQYGGKGIDRKEWLKVHVMCGCKTNIVTSVEVTHAHAGDSPQFASLVNQTSENFTMNTVCADKAYSSNKNLKLVLVKGAQPYIPFRSTATASGDQSEMWKRLYRFYQYHQEQFAMHYHKRSNVETVFSMIKAKFGERLRSKTVIAQTNEVLCKVLAHNICCLIQSIYELGVEPNFWGNSA